MNATKESTTGRSATAINQMLLDFWCRTQGYALKSLDGRIAVIDHGFGDTVWLIEDLVVAIRSSASSAASDLATLRLLSEGTYEIRHNPNCPAQFELRTAGVAGVIDRKEASATLNHVGYGCSLSEAALSLAERARRLDAGRHAGTPFPFGGVAAHG